MRLVNLVIMSLVLGCSQASSCRGGEGYTVERVGRDLGGGRGGGVPRNYPHPGHLG